MAYWYFPIAHTLTIPCPSRPQSWVLLSSFYHDIIYSHPCLLNIVWLVKFFFDSRCFSLTTWLIIKPYIFDQMCWYTAILSCKLFNYLQVVSKFIAMLNLILIPHAFQLKYHLNFNFIFLHSTRYHRDISLLFLDIGLALELFIASWHHIWTSYFCLSTLLSFFFTSIQHKKQ